MMLLLRVLLSLVLLNSMSRVILMLVWVFRTVFVSSLVMVLLLVRRSMLVLV